MGAPVIVAEHVSKSYRSDGQVVLALEDTSLQVLPKEVVWLHGESGSGKTTLLNLIGLLTPPDSGRLVVGGQAIAWESASLIARLRRQLIGFVFQSHNLVGWLSAADNVLLAGDRTSAVRAQDLLSSLGLADRLHLEARRLSGGEQQRVAIARAILNHPSIVLADEPISGLDEVVSVRVLEALAGIAADGACVLIASHQALVGEYCTREVRMSHGHEVARRGSLS